MLKLFAICFICMLPGIAAVYYDKHLGCLLSFFGGGIYYPYARRWENELSKANSKQ